MNAQDVKRKLTAILSADVEGYSRLMGRDDVGTIRTLTAYRDTMTNLIVLHRGRVVDAPGDKLLAEFVRVVDAVHCAVEIQRDGVWHKGNQPAGAQTSIAERNSFAKSRMFKLLI